MVPSSDGAARGVSAHQCGNPLQSDYRGLCPRIGGVKLYLLLASDLGKEVTHGRDAFLKFYAEKNFRLPRNKPIHTTNSNHVYRKYPNLVKGSAGA